MIDHIEVDKPVSIAVNEIYEGKLKIREGKPEEEDKEVALAEVDFASMAEETEKTSIKQLFQGMVGNGAEVLQGIVKSTSPLKIQIVNDEKLIIGQNITIVPWHLTDYSTEVTVHWRTESESGGSGDASFASHSHAIEGRKAITVHNALKMGRKYTFWLSTTGSSISCWIG